MRFFLFPSSNNQNINKKGGSNSGIAFLTEAIFASQSINLI